MIYEIFTFIDYIEFMSVEKLHGAVRDYVESGGKLGPDRVYKGAMQRKYESEFERTYKALDKIYQKTGKMGAIGRAAEFLEHDVAKSRSTGGDAVSGDAGADAIITFCIEKLRLKFPCLR